MGIFDTIRSLLGGGKSPEPPKQSFDVESFIYIKMPGNIQPMERGELFEDKIDPVLARDNLGTVSGGGSLLSDPRPDGTRVVESCGIDIDVTDLDRALEVLRGLLPQLDAPLGTELHYTQGGAKLQDALTSSGWQLEQSRTDLHPGFGI
jgi:hypothetical protein